MIPKSGNRFSEKIMLRKKLELDGDSKKLSCSRACLQLLELYARTDQNQTQNALHLAQSSDSQISN
jgi:hypothetical protein